MFVVDTNVFVHAVDGLSPFHSACRGAVERWRSTAGAWFTTWSILYEFLRVTTHPKIFRPALRTGQAWAVVESLLASPGLTVLTATGRHAAVAAEVLCEVPDVAGNLMHDVHVAILMREHGVRRIYTRDAGFHRFPFLEPVDPVRPATPSGTEEPAVRYRATKRR